MKIYEFGAEHERIFVMFQCAAEPWWVFKGSAEAMARDHHVFLVIADGHDEQGTTFVSIEKNVMDVAAYLRSKGVRRDRKSTRLNSSHTDSSRMPSSA